MVKQFSFILEIDGQRYLGRIPAHSWDEAQRLAFRFGATVDGELVEEQNVSLCPVCQGTVSRDLSEAPRAEAQIDLDWEESPTFEE